MQGEREEIGILISEALLKPVTYKGNFFERNAFQGVRKARPTQRAEIEAVPGSPYWGRAQLQRVDGDTLGSRERGGGGKCHHTEISPKNGVMGKGGEGGQGPLREGKRWASKPEV